MKKFSAIIICLLMILTCTLTGCASFSIDKVKYYNEVVAKVGETNILRYELLNAYSSYGYSYFVSQQGKTESEALKSTLDLLMDRESLYQYALTKPELKPTPAQVNSVVKSLFDSLDGQMSKYTTDAKNILNIKTEKEAEATSNDEKVFKRLDFDYNSTENDLRRAHLVFDRVNTIYYTDATKQTISETATSFQDTKNIYKIEYLPKTEEAYTELINASFLNDFNQDGIINEIITKYFAKLSKDLEVEGSNATAIYNKARSLMATDLLNNEYYLRDSKGKPFSKDTDDLIYRYFERNFNSQIKSQYLTNIRTNYLDNQVFSIEDLEAKYLELYTASYQKYKNKPETYKNDMKNISQKADTILYHPELADGTQFGYFIHTLLNFDDTTKNQISDLNKSKDSLDETTYNNMYNQLIANLKVNVRDLSTGKLEKVIDEITGEEVDKKVDLSVVLNEYDSITNISNYDDKLNAFIDFIYKYTGDTATLSAGMPYVVGNNGNSTMEQAFTDEAVRLMNENAGAMTDVELDNACITSYGIHYLFYIGDVKSFDLNNPYAGYIDFENRIGNNNNLYHTEINPITNKTYFDMLFDTVYPATSQEESYSSNNGYSEEEIRIIAEIRKTNPSKIYSTKLKGTKIN